MALREKAPKIPATHQKLYNKIRREALLSIARKIFLRK
jgi:hypothetical protein